MRSRAAIFHPVPMTHGCDKIIRYYSKYEAASLLSAASSLVIVWLLAAFSLLHSTGAAS